MSESGAATLTAGLVSGSALLVAALVAVAGALVLALRAVDDHDTARSRAALGVSACFVGAATGVLLRAIILGNLSYSWVANHTALNLGAGERMLAMFDGGPATALVMAAVVGTVGTVLASSATAIATISIVVTALLSAALSGDVLAQLPWTAAEGLGLTPILRHPLAGVAATGAIAGAVAATAAASRSWQIALVRGEVRRWTCTSFAALLLAAVAMGDAALLSGVSHSPVSTGASGVWLAASVATAWSALRPLDSGGIGAHVAGCVALAAVLAASLAGMGAQPPNIVAQGMVLAVLMVGLVSAVAWRGTGPSVAGRRHLDVTAMLALLSLAVLATTVMLTRSRVEQVTRLSVGEVANVGGAEVAHQGLSRYEAEGSHVLAVALEVDGQVLSAEKREYFDSQGVVVGEVASPPAVVRGAWYWTYLWLDGAEAGDVARLRSQRVSFGWGWWLSVLLAFGAATASWWRTPPMPNGALVAAD